MAVAAPALEMFQARGTELGAAWDGGMWMIGWCLPAQTIL